MKLKIKNSVLATLSPVYIAGYLLAALIVLVLLQLLITHLDFVASEWKDFLSYSRERGLLNYVTAAIFPALVALWVVLFFWSRASRWSQVRKTNMVALLSFEEAAVRLVYQKKRADVILPYAETDFSVGLPVMLTYNKGGACPHLAELEITFSHAGKNYPVFHKGKLPVVQALLDEGKKFRSCTAEVKRQFPEQPIGKNERDFIQFLEKQLENHRRYGLLLPQYPVPRAIFTILGVIGVGALDLGLGMLAMFLFTTSAWLLFPVILLLMVAGLTFWCAVDIKNYFAFRAVAAKLEKLKQNLPY